MQDWEPMHELAHLRAHRDVTKGQAWGLKTVESFHTYGTPPVTAKTDRT